MDAETIAIEMEKHFASRYGITIRSGCYHDSIIKEAAALLTSAIEKETQALRAQVAELRAGYSDMRQRAIDAMQAANARAEKGDEYYDVLALLGPNILLNSPLARVEAGTGKEDKIDRLRAQLSDLREAVHKARTNFCGYMITKEHPYEEVTSSLWKEIKRMDSAIESALARV